jgi:hypothetical protein
VEASEPPRVVVLHANVILTDALSLKGFATPSPPKRVRGRLLPSPSRERGFRCVLDELEQ